MASVFPDEPSRDAPGRDDVSPGATPARDETPVDTHDDPAPGAPGGEGKGEAAGASGAESESTGPARPASARPTPKPRDKGRIRRAVFGSLWLVIGVAIAASLVKIAFVDSGGDEPPTPTGQLAAPTVQVTRGDVVNEFTVAGSVTADAGEPIRATDQGTVTLVYVELGDEVDAGDALLEIREEVGQTEPEPIGMADPETGYQEMTDPEPIYQYHVITAPESGVVTAFTPLAKMQVGIGEEIGEIGPGTFTVVADLAADQQYRMLDRPSEASVSISGGPAPFECTSLDVAAAEQDSGGGEQPVDPYMYDPYGEMGGGGGTGAVTGQIRCAVPEDQAVFAGLGAEVTVVAGSAEDVLLVPVTAVRGDYATGTVYLADGAADVADPAGDPAAEVPSEDGAPAEDGIVFEDEWVASGGEPGGDPREVTVELGLTDGVFIEVTDGLEEGRTILEYVPSEVPMSEGEGYGVMF